MPAFTIETTYRIPVYRQRRYEARTLAEACRLAVKDDNWKGGKQDFDCAGETYVTGAWPADIEPYSVELLTIPTQFRETIQRQADHFGELLVLVSRVAQHAAQSSEISEPWLKRVQAAVRKAEAILAGARDPDGEGSAPLPHDDDRGGLTFDAFDALIDDASHAVNNLIPDSVISDLSDKERSKLLMQINDALTAVLDDVIPRDFDE